MPDERDTQTAATPADGDSTQDAPSQATATATATQDPPETPDAEATAEGGDAGTGAAAEEPRQESPEPDSDVKAEAETETDGDGESAETATQTRAEEAGEDDPGSAEAEPQAAAPDAEAEDRGPAAAEAKGDDEAATAEAKAEEVEAEEAKADETKAEEVEAEEAKAEETKADETKADEAKAQEAEAEKAEPQAAGAEKAAAEGTKAEDTKKEAAAAAAGGDEAEAEAGDGKDEAPELDDPTLQALRQAKEEKSTISGKVIGWNRGGFHVVIDEVTAFCPASEMELGRPRSPDVYMDREMEFKVAKFQRRGRRVVLSRTDVLKEQREEILARLQPGAVVEGTVTSLPDFGAFVDLGGVEGLVHVSEISHQRVKQPRDVLQSGQKVEVKILKIEQGGDRISLSMKELEPDPWKDIADKYSRGSQVPGKILRHADFGMFVELEPNVEGLVHVSQLAPGQDMKDDDLQPGKEIQVWIREVEPKRERISLSLKEVPDEDPWKTVQTRFPEGESFEGTVESVAPFGVFINLAPGLTGLLPNSQTGLPRGTNANRAFRPGQTVEVQVLAIDTRRKRISLGRPGARVEATKADLQEFRKQQKEQEKQAPSAMEAAFARLGLGGDDEE